MTCFVCGDKGLIAVPWTDAPDDYAVCACLIGLRLRSTRNHGRDAGHALWQLWAIQQRIDPSRMFFLEEVLTPKELFERGFGASTAPASREAALLATGRMKPQVRS